MIRPENIYLTAVSSMPYTILALNIYEKHINTFYIFMHIFIIINNLCLNYLIMNLMIKLKRTAKSTL